VTSTCNFLRETAWRIILIGLFLVSSASVALAISSPELVIGSVSSLSQIFGVAVAMMTGTGAYLARRLGLKSTVTLSSSAKYLTLGLGTISVILAGIIFVQYQNFRSANLERLQQTLVRPAQFDGTKIQDENLIETSFSKQETNSLAITTEEAAQYLAKNSNTVFLDIRETGENAMGTLPGAIHTRYPDVSVAQDEFGDKQVVLFCFNGNRSSETCEKLAALGIDCKFIAGGIEKWLVEGRPLSDTSIEDLSDLRALPPFENDTKLLGTKEFAQLNSEGNLQILDTRYPGDFASGFLPGAINIPIRALPTDELEDRISALEDKPTVVACYDRRSCFMGQVLAYELSKVGIPFIGRYTTPWEFFVPEPIKPHVQAWLLRQNAGLWDKSVERLAAGLVWIAKSSGLIAALVGLAVVSRLIVLPITLKSERDQIVSARNKTQLAAIKERLKHDPVRRARALQQHYEDLNITPVRNLLGLLFLPLMMLGLSAVERAAQSLSNTVFGLDLGLPDPTYVLPTIFGLLAGIYLQWVAAKTRRQAVLWMVIATPLVFLLGSRLSVAGGLYLCTSLVLLLIQRTFVTGHLKRTIGWLSDRVKPNGQPMAEQGVFALRDAQSLRNAGNKSLRLSVMQQSGLPVPDGVVLSSKFVSKYVHSAPLQRDWLADLVWNAIGERRCAVRSSSKSEDGAENSFAGVFESVLDVDRQSLSHALDQVIASFSAARVESYSAKGAHQNEANIVVQHMIDAEFSGVLFTQDPSASGLQMVEVVEGCGENLVSGNVTPTTLRFGRYSGRPVGAEIAPINLEPLLHMGRKIEALFQMPQDIEWAYADGHFHILQSRDITAQQGQSDAAKIRNSELARLLDLYSDRDPHDVILEQDELSEVLPQPTPISFDLMSRLWSPGGSLDHACRRLGVPYNLPENRPGHMLSVFGRTFVDTRLKNQTALRLGRTKARHLRKSAATVRADFQSNIVPKIRSKVVRLQAMDFAKLPHAQLLDAISEIETEFVQHAYVEAEVINILAGFLFSEAMVGSTASDRDRLMTPVLPNSPIQRVAACLQVDKSSRDDALIVAMGHRAAFDYELSEPRYCEDPALLIALSNNAGKAPGAASKYNASDAISMAIAFQDLKEQAKHETLRLVHQLRRALLALAGATQLGDLLFYMSIDEVLSLSSVPPMSLVDELTRRKSERSVLLAASAPAPSLTLFDLELLSAPTLKQSYEPGKLGGTCVSGTGRIIGKVFKVAQSADPDTAFANFRQGDIIVCSVIDPNWLPYVQQSGGVLAEVGGWLSHMAIIARESGVMMHVKCSGIMDLQTGQTIEMSDDGIIKLVEPSHKPDTNAESSIAEHSKVTASA